MMSSVILLLVLFLTDAKVHRDPKPCSFQNHAYFVIAFDEVALCGGVLISKYWTIVAYECFRLEMHGNVTWIRAGPTSRFQFRLMDRWSECDRSYCEFMLVKVKKPFNFDGTITSVTVPHYSKTEHCKSVLEVYATFEKPWHPRKPLSMFCTVCRIVNCSGIADNIFLTSVERIGPDDICTRDFLPPKSIDLSPEVCVEHSGGVLLCEGYVYGFIEGYSCEGRNGEDEEKSARPRVFKNIVTNLKQIIARTGVARESLVEGLNGKSRSLDRASMVLLVGMLVLMVNLEMWRYDV